MKKTLLLCASAACAAVLASGSTLRAEDNWMGTWKLNLAKSTYDPGPAPRSQTLTFEKAKDAIRLVSYGINAEGMPMRSEYTSMSDGKDVHWAGNPNADTASPRRIDANTYENVWKKDGKPTITSRGVVSADGKTLTVTQTGTDAQGRAVNTVTVYDRQ
jgi:hypothetical protein